MEEKRRLARFTVEAPARLDVDSGEVRTRIDSFTRDVSASGAFVLSSDSAVSVGSEVQIEIDLTVDPRRHIEDTPRGVCMVGRGIVTRLETNGLAVKFDGQLKFA